VKHTTVELLKFKRLQRKLQIDRVRLIGHLELLWMLTAKNARQGDIGKFSNEEIAIEIDWPEDPDFLIAALVETGWLDRCARHRLIVHDWSDHCPHWVHGVVERVHGGFVEPVAEDEKRETPPDKLEEKPADKPKAKPSGRFDAKAIEIPAKLQTVEFVEAWGIWVDHRKEIRKPLTPRAAAMCLQKLADMGLEDSMAAILHSVANGWQGLHLPKPEDRGKRDSQTHSARKVV